MATYKIRSVGGLDVMVNESTGALLIDIGGATIEVDLVETDVAAIVDGIAGNPPKTLAELHTLLTTIAGKDFATQTTLAAVLAKLSADPATETTLAAVLAKLAAQYDGVDVLEWIAEMSDDIKTNTQGIDGSAQDIKADTWEIRKNAVANTRQPLSHRIVVASAGTPVRLADTHDDYYAYIHARVQAVKPGEQQSSSSPSQQSGSPSSSSSSSHPGEDEGGPGNDTLPSTNTGNIYIWNGDQGKAAFILTPGQTLELPPNCHLGEFWIDAEYDGDGVVVLFSTDETYERPSSSWSSSSSSAEGQFNMTVDPDNGLSPDISALVFEPFGEYDGRPSWKAADAEWYVWWDTDRWYVTTEVSSLGTDYWRSGTEDNDVPYDIAFAPQGTASGGFELRIEGSSSSSAP